MPCGRRLGRRTVAALVLAGIAISACRNVFPAFGHDSAAARANADELFRAFAVRFTNVARSPKFGVARSKFGRSALAPSTIYGDTSLWTAMAGDTARTLIVAGHVAGGHYLVAEQPSAPLPRLLGDTRHSIRLRRLGDSDYEWTTGVEHAVGSVRADELAAGIGAVLGAAGGRPDAELRTDVHSSAPRASAALGRLLSLDAVRSRPATDGAPLTVLVSSVHTERLRAAFPAYAAYLDKYLVPARGRLTLTDAGGARWLDVSFQSRKLTVTVRPHAGQLTPLEGAVRPMPDTLRLRMALYAKPGHFTVGASDIDADVITIRTPHERGWLLRFRREPDWHFPLSADALIHSSLRRPFEREGILVRLAVHDSAGTQTLITRHAHVVVRESAIVRWLGKLGGNAMSDFAGRAEAEENRFTAELFDALAGDVRAALSPGAVGR